MALVRVPNHSDPSIHASEPRRQRMPVELLLIVIEQVPQILFAIFLQFGLTLSDGCYLRSVCPLPCLEENISIGRRVCSEAILSDTRHTFIAIFLQFRLTLSDGFYVRSVCHLPGLEENLPAGRSYGLTPAMKRLLYFSSLS